jgi:hypothetical protein
MGNLPSLGTGGIFCRFGIPAALQMKRDGKRHLQAFGVEKFAATLTGTTLNLCSKLHALNFSTIICVVHT